MLIFYCTYFAIHMNQFVLHRTHQLQDFDALSRMLSALAHLIYCNDDAVELLTALEFPAAAAFDARAAAAVADIHAMLASQ